MNFFGLLLVDDEDKKEEEAQGSVELECENQDDASTQGNGEGTDGRPMQVADEPDGKDPTELQAEGEAERSSKTVEVRGKEWKNVLNLESGGN